MTSESFPISGLCPATVPVFAAIGWEDEDKDNDVALFEDGVRNPKYGIQAEMLKTEREVKRNITVLSSNGVLNQFKDAHEEHVSFVSKGFQSHWKTLMVINFENAI